MNAELKHAGPVDNESYLAPQQLNDFQEQLMGWRRKICASLAVSHRPREVEAQRHPDWIDSASVNTQVELSWVKHERALQTLKEIDAALDRIREGSYGYCSVSGEEIGLKRLKAFPIARFAVAIQEEIEHRKRIFR